jgi:hypothetical protein
MAPEDRSALTREAVLMLAIETIKRLKGERPQPFDFEHRGHDRGAP